MVSLLEKRCEKWVDECGDDVLIVPSPCGGKLYRDKICRDLRDKYNPHLIKPAERMGKSEYEQYADMFCSFSNLIGHFVGLATSSLNIFENLSAMELDANDLLLGDYLRLKKVAGVDVLMPTEKLVRMCFKEWERKF